MYQGTNAQTAHIAINRGRVKEYSNRTVYLNDGQEFEIELYNPSSVSVLAKIYINGNLISDSGVVIRPGQRAFLERYLENNRKFKFGTYEVENTHRSKTAIKENGIIRVEFYKEITHRGSSNTTITLYNSNWNSSGGATPYSYTTAYPPSFTNNLAYCSTNNASFTSGMLNSSLITANAVAGSLETGRVEAGGNSAQSFESVNGAFESFCTVYQTLRILPASQKPIEVSEIRNYCSECGTRVKRSSWKFCPSCGNDLKN